jgi:hypothetical protein
VVPVAGRDVGTGAVQPIVTAVSRSGTHTFGKENQQHIRLLAGQGVDGDAQRGLLKEVVGRDKAGAVVYRAGVMGVVLTGGDVRSGDPIRVVRPSHGHRPLERV